MLWGLYQTSALANDYTFDIATVVIAIIALVISGITYIRAYERPFREFVIPQKSIVLTHYGENIEPCILLTFEFINTGIKTGMIDDILVFMTLSDPGNGVKLEKQFVPIYTRDKVDIITGDNGNSQQVFQDFNPVWLQANDLKSLGILFAEGGSKASRKSDIIPGKYSIRIKYTCDGSHDEWFFAKIRRKIKYFFQNSQGWKKARFAFTVKITQKDLDGWNNNTAVKIDSEENSKRRNLHYENQEEVGI